MQIIDCIQGSPEWFQARLGIPTASRFGMILTPTGKPSGQIDAYVDELVCEWLAGVQIETEAKSKWMDRGTMLEPAARKEYAFFKTVDVLQVGFCVSRDGKCGASPDGLVDANIALELKSPKHTTMLKYYRDGFPAGYKPQVQGQLMVCEREFCDFYAYHPDLLPFYVRIERDETYIKLLKKGVAEFTDRLEDAKEELKAWKVSA